MTWTVFCENDKMLSVTSWDITQFLWVIVWDSNSFHSTHYCDVIMGTMASQITSLTIVYSTVYSDADQTKHQSSASLAFARGIHRGPLNFPHKWPVTRKIFPFDDVTMSSHSAIEQSYIRVGHLSACLWLCCYVWSYKNSPVIRIKNTYLQRAPCQHLYT